MSTFQFKQFAVDQTGCAMKVNTDGVLLGALAKAETVKSILDIGTGTGVIALMLAQRFPDAEVDAVEIDEVAALTAKRNFESSPFAYRLNISHTSFQDYFQLDGDRKYDLIVSNPPFHLNSLKSSNNQMAIARHTDQDFFEELISNVPNHLTAKANFTLILPLQAALLVKKLAANVGLFLQSVVEIQSYPHSAPHREMVTFSLIEHNSHVSQLVIYDSMKVYSAQYRTVLSSFLTIF